MGIRKPRLWWKILVGLAIPALMAAGLCYLYWPSVTQGHLARISDATDLQLPDIARAIPFDGPVDYLEFHGLAARYPRYLIASHLSAEKLKALCALHDLSELPNELNRETPPFSDPIINEFKLDPKVFAFRCEGKMYVTIIGNTSGMPQWQIEADYCPSSGQVIMHVMEIGK